MKGKFALGIMLVLTVAGVSHAAEPSASAADRQVIFRGVSFGAPQEFSQLQSENFKQAWAAADSERIIKSLKVAWQSRWSVTTSFDQVGPNLKLPPEMKFPSPERIPMWDRRIKVNDMTVLQDGRIRLAAKLILSELESFAAYNEAGEKVAAAPVYKIQEKELVCELPNGGSVAEWFPDPLLERTAEKNNRVGLVLTVCLLDKPSAAGTAENLEKIIIRQVKFENADVQEVLNYLQDQSKEQDPLKMGVKFVFKTEPTEADPAHPWPEQRTLTLNLRKVPLKKVLDCIQELTPYQYKAEIGSVYVCPKFDLAPRMLVRVFAVPENFLTVMVTGTNVVVDAKDELRLKGVEFLREAAAEYLPKTKRLVVRNTEEQLKKIDALLKENATGR